jgi:hypothetical protein
MMKKTFPSSPMSLQVGLGWLELMEFFDPTRPESDFEFSCATVIGDPFRG